MKGEGRGTRHVSVRAADDARECLRAPALIFADARVAELWQVSHKEASVLLTMLPEYLHRIQAGASLLMRICGLYHVHAVKDARPVFFIVAISVFDDSGLGLHQQFDLKGSSAGRTARDHEAVKKDNNWTQGKMRVNLPADMKRSVAAALEADATFLARHQVCVYAGTVCGACASARGGKASVAIARRGV